jgi:hypothetical protein
MPSSPPSGLTLEQIGQLQPHGRHHFFGCAPGETFHQYTPIVAFANAQTGMAIIMSRAPRFGTMTVRLNAFKVGSEVSQVHD